MRLLIEIVIIGALVSLGWNTPFKEWSNRANTEIQRLLHSKRETPSGVTSILAPTAPLEREETLGKGGTKIVSRAIEAQCERLHAKPSHWQFAQLGILRQY